MRGRRSKIYSRSSKVVKSSRRSFLEAGLALPAILNTVPALSSAVHAEEVIGTADFAIVL